MKQRREWPIFYFIITGYVADAIGRRYTALAMDIPFIVAWICIIFAKSAGMLYFARFTIGKFYLNLTLTADFFNEI